MARKKLTKAALDFIIEKRNDWHVNYTFADIAKLLKEDFGITITEQAVSKSYRKYKDDEPSRNFLVATDEKNNSSVLKKKEYEHKVKPQIENLDEAKPKVVKKKISDFDENAAKKLNLNIDDYF